MTEADRPSPEEIVLYEKDPRTKIATITLSRPGRLNAPTAAARRRYARLIFQANVDDEVKVLVVRGVGADLGGGADLVEQAGAYSDDGDFSMLEELGIGEDEGVVYPPKDSYRYLAQLTQAYANPAFGCRSLQEFKKISILEAKGYCYGWHFYQAADADLVIASDDTLFGHPAFRYAGWGPRMWQWATMMGMRRFQEMVFTGRPFGAEEMRACGFVNAVAPREALEAEVEKYALACARTRPTDTVMMQKTFFEIMKQQQGEYMGSLLTGWLESMLPLVKEDGALRVGDELFEKGLGAAIRGADEQFPADFRLSKSGRKRED
jgi:enoyl-CoA hydratase/carnithine racemase